MDSLMSPLTEESRIETRGVSNCMLCNHTGDPLYVGMQDRLFGASGIWTLKRCSNDKCGLVWLDPMPTEADIGKAYRSYYTHGAEPVSAHPWLTGVTRTVIRMLNVLAFPLAIRLRHERYQASIAYLGDAAPGSLLEVGCGDGSYLDRMRTLGWSVEGVEVDEQAVQNAVTRFGLKVHPGTLEQVNLAEAAYDAVVLRHVIEHVHNPVGLLKECFRVLRPGGSLVVITPNIRSLAHRRFGQDWLHLDPPRHLHLFSSTTLETVAQRAGFVRAEVRTTPAQAESSFLSSQQLRLHRGGRHSDFVPNLWPAFKAACFQFWEQLYSLYDRESGEEVVMKGSK